MASKTNFVDLRAQIAANMSALRMSTTADIITVMANDGDWQAMIVEHSEIFERTEKWAKTKEARVGGLSQEA